MPNIAPELSIVIPAYNEAKRLPATLAHIAKHLPLLVPRCEVIVVVDGSTDNTVPVVQAASAHFPVPLNLVVQGQNQGKGAAVRAGVAVSRGEWILLMDADNATPITELPKLWAKREEAPFVLGSRYVAGSTTKIAQPLIRRIISRLGNVLIRLMVGLNLADTQNGFKLMQSDVAQPIFAAATIDRWGFDIEILANAHRQGHSIIEVPVAWSDAAGSKLRAGRDAWRTFQELLKIRKQIRNSK